MRDAEIQLAGELVRLLPERAAYWVAARTLLVADLHWGKSEVLQRSGIPLPSTALGDDLVRLAAAIRRTGAKRVVALGDLVHAHSGVTPAVADMVAQWRQGLPDVSCVLVRGNHDRGLQLPPSWGFSELADGTREGAFRFTHAGGTPEPQAASSPRAYSWQGHLHPSVTLRAGADRVRVPCFVVRPDSIVLPAFGALTGTHDIAPDPEQRIYALTGTAVLAV